MIHYKKYFIICISLINFIQAQSRGVNWCKTMDSWSQSDFYTRACNSEGDPDDPSYRDSYIPNEETEYVIIRLYVHGFSNDDGSVATTNADKINAQMETLNQDFASSKIQFIYEYMIYSHPAFTYPMEESDIESMKDQYAYNPNDYHNIYVIDIVGEDGDITLGSSTFPWDSTVFNAQGGTIMHQDYFGGPREINGIENIPQRTLTHELGHALGLWHVFRGVDETEECGDCYEFSMNHIYDGDDNSDVRGDMCSDTYGTPTSMECSEPEEEDCDGDEFVNTPLNNFLNYTPDNCMAQFTNQQAGRMHAWIEYTLSSYVVDDEADCTADDGTNGVELWGECYSIENTTALNLEDSGLTGEIPSEIGDLINLTNLEIGGNQLTGSIPPEIGNLINLVDVNMGFNDLTGSIPPELGNLVNLIYFYAAGNDLTGSIPPELGNMSSLEGLWLMGNDLTGSIPPELGNLTNLEGLWLYNNQLTGSIPPELGNMTNMNELNLNYNQLSGSIPSELGDLVNLGSLEVSNNELTGSIPPEIMNHMGYLAISNNQLNGVIPESICNLIPDGGNWESHLSISNNQLCPLYPDCLSNELYLEQDISNCEFEIWGESYLNGTTTELDLSNSALSDTIPPVIGYLTNLTSLNLENNQLVGTIPSEIGFLENLDTLILADNQLTGVIPESICNLYSDLDSLSIANNQLCPIYPSCLNYYNFDSQDISECAEWECEEGYVELWYECYSIENTIYTLNLENTGLIGEIPPEIGNLTNVRNVYLNNNNLTGEIPPEIINMAALRQLNLEDNQLTGVIPPEIGDHPNYLFDYLFLKNNQFSGVSENICDLNLYWQSSSRFSISGNQICWPYPDCIEDYMGEQDISECTPCQLGVEGHIWLWDECYSIENTTSLNLEDSGLTGEIPSEIGGLINLDTLNLSDNQLTGVIPDSICNIYPNMSSFSISNNQLCPPLPECINYGDFVPQDVSGCTEWECDEGDIELWFDCYSIETTTSLNLENIGLTGDIPSEIGSLTNLTILDLSNNEITGDIPSELSYLTDLDTLNLSHNQLTGEIPSELSDLSDLYKLNLGYNQLTGEIPPALGTFWTLTTLNLAGNQLIGEIPASFSGLYFIHHLNLSHNQLTGVIPSGIPGGNLIELNISNNQLTGSILPEIGNMVNLTGLWLNSNQLTGEIPLNISSLANLSNLNLSFNQLSGNIPGAICELSVDFSDSNAFSITENQLCPPYPYCIEDIIGNQYSCDCDINWEDIFSECGALCSYDNTTNQANCSATSYECTEACTPGDQSCIDTCLEIDQLCYDEALNIFNDCNLSCQLSIAECAPCVAGIEGYIELWDQCYNIIETTELDLSNSGLTGEISPDIGNMTNLNILYLNDNQLIGEIPDSICNIFNDSLSFDFSNNQLCPPYPSCIEEYSDNDVNNSLEYQNTTNCPPLSIVEQQLPSIFTLYEPYPNPFNPITIFRYDLPKRVHVVLVIYDLMGREVAQLVNITQEAGFKSVQWNATGSSGRPVSAGIYILQLRAGEFVQTKKLILLQ